MSAVLLGDSNFMTYDVCQILTQSILIEMFRTFGCLEKLDGWRSANGYKDHASPEKAAIFHTRLKAHTIRHNNTTMAHKGTHKHNITALNFTMSESLWCQIYIFLFCLTNIQVICANFSIQLFELRATFNFAIISRRRSPASSRLRLGKGYRKYSSPCRRTLRPGGLLLLKAVEPLSTCVWQVLTMAQAQPHDCCAVYRLFGPRWHLPLYTRASTSRLSVSTGRPLPWAPLSSHGEDLAARPEMASIYRPAD